MIPRCVRLAALVGAVSCLACGQPKIDSADLAGSAAKVRKGVEARRRPDFDLAWKTVEAASRGEVEGTPAFSIDGLTGDAIFEEARKIGLRRDIVWCDRTIADEQQVLDAAVTLAKLRVSGFTAGRAPDDGQVSAIFDLENGLDTAIDSGWIRIDVGRPDGGTMGGEDLVELQPALQPGGRRQVRILVSSDAARVLAEVPGAPVSARFTQAQLAGNVVAQLPTPEALEKAKRRLAEEKKRGDDLRSQLSH